MNTGINEPLDQVLANYDINVSRIMVETYKNKKGVWWIETGQDRKILKKMPMSKDRLLFVLSAVEHLLANGVNIPKIIKTKAGGLFVEIGEANFLLSEAITAKPPGYNVPSELAMIMRGMAGFHAASRGYKPPAEAKIRTHLGIWPKTYQERINDLESFKEKAVQNETAAFDAAYLAECDFFIKQAQKCLADLANSQYSELVKTSAQNVNLCHQDFAAGNLGLAGKDCLYVFDTDGITYDLAARDIRKICNKVMKKRGLWDFNLFKTMLQAYHSVNPLSPGEYEVLLTDIRFPHLFYGIASKYYQNREKEWPEQKYLQRLQQMIKTEKSKIPVLEAANSFDWLDPKINPEVIK